MLWLVPHLLFLGLVLVYPMLNLLARGVDFAVLTEPFILERLGVTLLQASLSSLLVLGLGLMAGSLLARYSFRGKALLEAVLSLPFVVPVMVASLGFLSLFGSRGWLVNLEGTLWLVLLANVFYNLGLTIRFVMAGLRLQSLELEDIARLEGATAWQVWRFVTLPAALPSALIGTGFTFLYTFASFGIPLLLGGTAFATLEVEMFLQIQRLELGTASALALLQLLVSISAAFAVTYLERQHTHSQTLDEFRPRAKGWTRVVLGLMILGLLFLTFAPLLAVAVRSLTDSSGFTLIHYQKLFTTSSSVFSLDLGTAIWNNLRFALLSLALAVPLALSYALALWRKPNKFFDALSLLPLAVSSTVLGVGLIVSYPKFTASLELLIAVYVLSAYPLITRAFLNALRRIEPNLLEAASLDGAGLREQFRFVIFPLTASALGSGMALGFAVVVGEFAATLMLQRPEWATLTTLIYQRLSRPNQIGEASALAMILLLLSCMGFLLIAAWARQPTSQQQQHRRN